MGLFDVCPCLSNYKQIHGFRNVYACVLGAIMCVFSSLFHCVHACVFVCLGVCE